MSRVTVAGPAPYEVVIGPGAQAELALVLAGTPKAAVVHAPPLAAAAGAAVETLQSAGVAAEAVVVPDGEAAKTAGVAAGAWEEFGRLGLTRSDAVVGIGGGAVTDLAGFLAATWTRGIRVVQVPTSLLGMVDAAVGGKTGINTGAGKNLVGAFHPPAAVLADTDLLAGLPEAEFRSGLAEVVKCGFIADPAILRLLGEDPTGRARTEELVTRAVQVKADAVGEDLYDLGRREFLNYGHTLAHAIERVEDFGWRHGEAVAVGLVFAAELAGRAGLLAARRRRPAPDAGRRDGPAHHLPRRLGAAAVGHAGGQEGPRRVAALRRPRRDAEPHDPDRPRPGLARRRLGGRERRSRMTIQVLNGANLGRLGLREPEKYGTVTYAELVELVEVTARELGVEVQVRQTDDEGELLRWIHAAADAGDAVLINPGGWSHTSVVLRDALAALNAPLVEVHITNIHAREEFRHHSYVSGVADGVIAGLGVSGYILALGWLAQQGVQ